MSKVKKAKKLRRPNIPMATGPGAASGGGMETARDLHPAWVEPSPANFDYTYIKKDLTRIAVLAGSFFIILVVLSFFIK